MFKKQELVLVGRKVQRLRALVAFPEELGLVLCTYMAAHVSVISVLGGPTFWD